MKSRSASYSKSGEIEIIETEVDDPKAGELQVEGIACGICSWDIATCRLGDQMAAPAPPGHEGVGYVRKIGSGVSGFKEGDRVACGGFHKLANYPVEGAYKIPETDIPDEHWLVEPVACVVNGVDHCHLRAGDRVAVVGCGFMGLVFLQILARSYTDCIIGLDLEASRLELAQSFGVDEVYDLSKLDNGELARELKRKDIDVVVDTSGSQQGLDFATKIVKPSGQINLFGWIKGNQANFNPTAWHAGGFSIINSSPAAGLRDSFPPAIRLIQKGIVNLEPLVTHRVGLDEYSDLMKQILAGDKSYIKGVVQLG